MPQIKIIPAGTEHAKPLLRMAAYARTSSDSSDQQHSYAAQVKYYTEYIGSRPDWILTEVYADEGLTGTSADKALTDLASLNPAVIEMLKLHIGMGLHGNGDGEDEYALRQRLLSLENEIGELIELESQDGNQGNYDSQFEKLYGEKIALKAKLEQIQTDERHAGNEQARLTEVIAGMDKLRCQPIAFDDVVVRQMVDCVRVLSKERLRISFRLGGEVDVVLDAQTM